MSDHPAPFTRFFKANDLPTKKPRALEIKASAEERSAIAADLDLLDVSLLSVTAEIAPAAEGVWRVRGQVDADVAQACVVTLSPVTSTVSEPFDRLFSRYAEEDTPIDIDIEYDKDDPPEPLGAGVDLGAVAIEALALGLDSYPRAPGATFEAVSAAPPGAQPISPDAAKPFAGLASLKKAMDGGD